MNNDTLRLLRSFEIKIKYYLQLPEHASQLSTEHRLSAEELCDTLWGCKLLVLGTQLLSISIRFTIISNTIKVLIIIEEKTTMWSILFGVQRF